MVRVHPGLQMITDQDKAFREAKLEQYRQMRHGLYKQIEAFAFGLVKSIEIHQSKLPADQRRLPPNANAIINTVIAYIHSSRDTSISGWLSAVRRTIKLPEGF